MIRSDISPSCLRVLETVMRMADAGVRITIRGISDQLGWGSRVTWTMQCLKKLKSRGLVDYDPRRHATIRPVARFIDERLLDDCLGKNNPKPLDTTRMGGIIEV